MKTLVLLLWAIALPALAAPNLDFSWNAGKERCEAADAGIELHVIDPATVAIRQNPCVDPEANLIYVLVGVQRVLVIDSGAAKDPKYAAATAQTVARWLQATRKNQPLLVVHTHAHGDHHAGDAEFAKLPDAVVAPLEGEALRQFLHFDHWPEGAATIDLGNRVVDVIPSPGHEENHVVYYDRSTGLLFTGDFLLPGRLLVSDLAAYRQSARRIATFAASHPITAVLGAHVELDVKGHPYSNGATFHPDEHPLVLSRTDVLALPAALAEFNGFYSVNTNFIVVNPVHNLIALIAGAVVAFALLVWSVILIRRRKRRTSL
jgi:hydroxyacylglutathione hydrolase